ncbi:MAG TPA: endolytic transglycosylase MltG, partial [Bacteroidia bacterium]|nr:endolytic transglycosylase MltG [Bacteroidia bacterium]
MCAKKSGKALKRVFQLITLAVLLFAGYSSYVAFLKPNIYLDGKKYKFIYIPTKATYDDMIAMLEEENILQDKKTFEWLAKAYDLKNNFKPGRYRVIAGMTNRQLINSIKNGKQEKVKLTFNSSDHTNDDIIKKIADKLEISEEELETFFETNTSLREKYNFTNENLRCLFLPETYELNWNTSLPDFMKMVEENYADFWTSARQQKAKRA